MQLWGAEQAQAHAEEVFAVYGAVFGDQPDERKWRAELFDRHCARDGFRLSAALDDDRLVGFAWGTSASAASTGPTGSSSRCRGR